MELIIDLLKTATKRVTLVALAPLTNIALAIRTNAELCKERIERIIWMGNRIGGHRLSVHQYVS